MISMYKISYKFAGYDDMFYTGILVHSTKALSQWQFDQWLDWNDDVVAVIDDGEDIIGVHGDMRILEAIPY